MKRLKPCAFCGKRAVITSVSEGFPSSEETLYRITASHSCVDEPKIVFAENNKEIAVKQWNDTFYSCHPIRRFVKNIFEGRKKQ